MKALLPVIAILLLGVNACNHTDKNSSLIFEELNESLERSNKTLEGDIAFTIMRLEDLTKAPETADKGAILLSKGQKIKFYSSQILGFIDSLNAKLKESKNANEDLSNEGANLYKRLSNYRSEVLSVDDNIRKEFEKSMPIADSSFKKMFPNEEIFANHFFT